MNSMPRTKSFVDSHVQGALVKRIMSHWLTLFVVLGLAILGLKTMLGDPGAPLSERFQSAKGDFLLISLIMLALVPVFVLDTIRFSNRFVGPIARFRGALRGLQEGNVSKLHFRSHDFWRDLADEFNGVAEMIEKTNRESQVAAEEEPSAPLVEMTLAAESNAN